MAYDITRTKNLVLALDELRWIAAAMLDVLQTGGIAIPSGGATEATQLSVLAALRNANSDEYETVAAGSSDQILGATGAVGDYLTGLLIVPAAVTAGTVSIKDGNGSAINVFVTGTLSSLVPFFVPIQARCVNATTPGWKVTTGASVSVFGTGNFT